MIEEKQTESENLENGKILNRLRKIRIIKVWAVRVFFAVLFTVAVIGVIIPLRPKFSESEKRELAKFPKIKLETLLNGEFFGDIDKWYSDTFPARDTLIKANAGITNLYGETELKIHGEVEEGDEIPSVDDTFDSQTDFEDDTSASQAEGGEASKPEVSSKEETSSKEKPKEESSKPVSSKEEASKTQSSKQETKDNTSSKTQASKTQSTKAESSKSESSPTSSNPKKQTKPQTLGALLIYGDTAYEYYNFNREVADKYSSSVKKAASLLKGKATVYDMVIPTSMGITLPDKYKKTVNSSDQEKAIKYIYSKLGSNVKAVPLYDALIAKRDEYLYFRTDHHWTALGAYYSYVELMKLKNIQPLQLTDFKKHQFKGYLGSFYNSSGKSPQLGKRPDVVYAYEPTATNIIKIKKPNGKWWESTIISDLSKTPASTKYLTFIKGDNGFSKINNPKLKDKSACIVIKESFGNAFVPFLVPHYQNIYVVDYRYFSDVDSRGLVKLQKDTKAKDVIFINNISATRNKALVDQINAFVKKNSGSKSN